MTLQIEALTPNNGALIKGFDFSQPMTDEVKQQLTDALVQHQVIFFKDQPITPHEQVKFAKQFGTLHIHPIFPHAEGAPEIVVLDNQQLDLADNSIWHTDVTFIEQPPLGSILAAKKVPAIGGDTVWSSSHAAWEALSPAYQRLLEGLTATHEFVNSFPLERFGNTPEAYAKWIQVQQDNPPVVHPVIRTHPVTGKKLIFVNEGFTSKINEVSPAEDEIHRGGMTYITKNTSELKGKCYSSDNGEKYLIWGYSCNFGKFPPEKIELQYAKWKPYDQIPHPLYPHMVKYADSLPASAWKTVTVYPRQFMSQVKSNKKADGTPILPGSIAAKNITMIVILDENGNVTLKDKYGYVRTSDAL